MRVRAIVGMLVAGALVAAGPPSAGADELKEIEFSAGGSIKVFWHGDQARGCAAAGLCRYSGSIVYPLRRGQAFLELEPDSYFPVFGFLDARGQTRARTVRTLAGGGTAVCSQHARSTSFTLSADRAWRGRDWLTLDTRIYPAPLASGECAGPRLEDIAPSLPSALVRTRDIEKRGERVSLRGRFAFAAGALTGHVTSTLHLTSRGVRREHLIDDNPGGGGSRHRHRHRRRHRLVVKLHYRLVHAQGEARRDFRAVSAPICRLRDACGSHGSEVYSLDDAGKRFDVYGAASVTSRRRPSLRHALRTVVRHGFVDGFLPVPRSAGLSSHAFEAPGGVACLDRFRPREQPSLALFGESGKLRLILFESEGSILRGRCPGPTDSQRGSDLGRLRVSPGQLRKKAVTLRLRDRGSFRRGAYSGTTGVRLNVRLRRTGASVKVDPHGDRVLFKEATSAGG